MNWNAMLELCNGQGFVFWGAIAAVALGLTLLTVSIVFQVRKVLSGSRFRLPRPARRRPGAITVTADGYEATPALPTPAPAPEPEPEPRDVAVAGSDDLTRALLARLRTAAERLEGVHSGLESRGKGNGPAGESPLKAPSSAVEYVYKTGRA